MLRADIGSKSWPFDIQLRPWVFRLIWVCYHGATAPVVTYALMQPTDLESVRFQKVPAQPVDATLYPRWKDEVYPVISEDSRLSVSSQAHLNKAVRQLNERPRKALEIETPAERFNASVASTG